MQLIMWQIEVKVGHILKITINEGGLKVYLGDIGREKSPPDLGFSQSCPPAPPGDREPSAPGPSTPINKHFVENAYL